MLDYSHGDYNLRIEIKMKKPIKSGQSRPSNRWRLHDAKARLSEVIRQAQQRGPQRVTLHGRDAVVVVRADEFDRMRRPISGRDIVAALAGSPLAEVNFERMTIKSPVRKVTL
jgi:prevent-host-death family protein